MFRTVFVRSQPHSKPAVRSNNVVVTRNVATKRKVPELPRNTSGGGQKKVSPFGYLLLAVPLTTFGLGTWQVQRKSWKEDLVKQMESKLHLAPEQLPDNLEDLQSMEYQSVAVRGHFLHDKEMVLGPRGLIKPGGGESAGGLISQKNSSSGYLIVTPFKLEGREETILVNRGWVSRQNLKPESRPKGQVEGTVDLLGVVRQPEPRPQFTPDHKSEMFLYRDVPRMCSLTGADPIFLDAKFESTVDGGPIGGQTRVTLRNEHLSYVVTWYSLSAFTAFLWWKQVMRRMPF